jgi:hypothetical protein
VSSLWTPGGERPVGRTPEPAGAAAPTPPPEVPGEHPLTEEEAEQARQMLESILATPVEAVLVNHVVSLLELGQLHLSTQPTDFAAAQLAIDAAAALVEGLVGRLGADETELKAAIAQMKLAFVQIRAAALGDAPPPSSN